MEMGACLCSVENYVSPFCIFYSVKPHFRLSNSSEHSAEVSSAVSVVSGDGQLHRGSSRNFQTERQTNTLSGHQVQSYSPKDSSVSQIEQNGDYSMGRGR